MKFSPELNYSFNANLADQIGPERALVLKELKVWCESHFNRGVFVFAGHSWCWYSAQQLHQKFPFYSSRSIARWLLELEDGFWLCSGSFNRMKNDRTKWYCVNLKRYESGVLGADVSNPTEWDRNWSKAIAQAIERTEFEGWHIPKGQEDPSAIQAPVVSVDVSISQNGESISQNGQSISQNGEPLPTLSNSDTTPFCLLCGIQLDDLQKRVGKKQADLLSGFSAEDLKGVSGESGLLLVEWLEHKRSIGKAYKARKGITVQFKKLREFSAGEIREAIDKAYSAGYLDFFPKKAAVAPGSGPTPSPRGKSFVPNLRKPEGGKFDQLADKKKG